MKRFKMALIAVALVGLVLGVQAQGWAALMPGDFFKQEELPEAAFFVVDDTNDSLTNVLLTLSDVSINGVLEYSVGNNTSWTSLTTFNVAIPVDTGLSPGGYVPVYLKVGDNTSATLTFLAFDRPAYGLDLFNSLMVDFGTGGSLELVITQTPNNKVAPTPIPPAALLLGVGMLGMVSFRKRGGRK